MIDYADLAEYVEAAKAGDESAFTHLYEKTCPMVYNITCTMLRDEEEARDATSEVYIRVFRYITQLEDNRAFIRWLIVIAQNVCRDHQRKYDSLPVGLADADSLEDPCDLIAEWQERESTRSLMQGFIRSLPEAQQRAIHCVYFRQLTVAQTAALEDCPVGTILSRLYYARGTLRRAILAEEKRTGDRYHLPVGAAALAALMAIPGVTFDLSPEAAAQILSAVFAAIGVEYTADQAPPVVTVLHEENGRLKRSYLVRLKPLFLVLAAVVTLTVAVLLISVGYLRGKLDAETTPPTETTTPPTETTAAPAETTAAPAETTAAPAETTAAPVETTAAPAETTAPPAETEPAETPRFDNWVKFSADRSKDNKLTITGVHYPYPEQIEDLLLPDALEGATLTTITTSAFRDVNNIRDLYLPQYLTLSIEAGDAPYFNRMDALENIFAHADSTSLCSIDGVLYSKDKTVLIAYPAGRRDKSFTVPDTVKRIGSYAFANPYLETVILPEGLETIGMAAFKESDSVKTVTIPASVNRINTDAFAAPNLESLYVENTAGGYCTIDGILFTAKSLRLVTYPAARPGDTYTLPAGSSGSFSGGFAVTKYLKTIYLPATAVKLDVAAFNGTTIEAIHVDPANQVFSSVDGVLYDRGGTRLVRYPAAKQGARFDLPDPVTDIGAYAFYRNAYLTAVTMTDSVKTIGDYAISALPALTELRLSDSIEVLPRYALADNDAIAEYILPRSLREVNKLCIAYCRNLMRVVFTGNGVTMKSSDSLNLAWDTCVIAHPKSATGWDFLRDLPNPVEIYE